MQDHFQAVEGGEAAFVFVVQRAKFLDWFVAEIERGDDRDKGGFLNARAVGEHQRDRDACGGDDLDRRGERLDVFRDLDLGGDEVAAGVGEAPDLALLEPERPDFARRGEILGEARGDQAEIRLQLMGPFDDLLADVAHWEHRDRHEQQAGEHEPNALIVKREHDQRAERGEELHRLLDAIAGEGRERGLELAGVGHATRNKVAAGLALHERQRQRLQLAKVVDADRLEDFHAAELDVIAVEIAAESAQEERQRDGGRDEDDRAQRQADVLAVKYDREDVFDQRGQADAVGQREQHRVENRRDQRPTHGAEVFEVGAEALHRGAG